MHRDYNRSGNLVQTVDIIYLTVLMLHTSKTLIVFPQAYCISITQSGESGLSTLGDDPIVHASDTNQSGRNPEPEAKAWWELTGTSVKKQQ